MEFSNAKMKDVIKSKTSKRVSENASTELGNVLEMFAGDVAEEAQALAQEAGRKTVRREDIKQALK